MLFIHSCRASIHQHQHPSSQHPLQLLPNQHSLFSHLLRWVTALPQLPGRKNSKPEPIGNPITILLQTPVPKASQRLRKWAPSPVSVAKWRRLLPRWLKKLTRTWTSPPPQSTTCQSPRLLQPTAHSLRLPQLLLQLLPQWITRAGPLLPPLPLTTSKAPHLEVRWMQTKKPLLLLLLLKWRPLPLHPLLIANQWKPLLHQRYVYRFSTFCREMYI